MKESMKMKIIKVDEESEINSSLSPTQDREEIDEIIHYMCKTDQPLTLWQVIDGERKVKKGRVVSFHPRKRELKLAPLTPQENFNLFKVSLPLYLHSPYQKVLTRLDVTKNSGTSLTLQAPFEVHTSEKEVAPRQKFLTDSYRVRFSKQDMTHDYPVLDISRTGMAFKVPIGPASIFNYKDDEICILNFFEGQGETSLKGHIVYIRPIEDEENKYRVGVKFYRPLSMEDLE